MINISPVPPPSRSPRTIALVLALVIAVVLIPAILKFQEKRFEGPAIEKRSWRMTDLIGRTQDDLIGKFGPPLTTKDYSLSVGAFAGPSLGLKHYYLLKDPDTARRLKTAPVSWTYPEYSAVREVIWKLPDSYLTVWLHEPRAEVSLQGETLDLSLPKTAAEAWVALDDYRIGKDLVDKPPAAAR